MRYLLLFALFLYGVLELQARQFREWGKIHPRDEIMFKRTFKDTWYLFHKHFAYFMIPNEGEARLVTVTYISIENRLSVDAEIELKSGGVGFNHAQIAFEYPESEPADITMIVRGIYNGPCRPPSYPH